MSFKLPVKHEKKKQHFINGNFEKFPKCIKSMTLILKGYGPSSITSNNSEEKEIKLCKLGKHYIFTGRVVGRNEAQK